MLRHRAVLPEQLNPVRVASPGVSSMCEVGPGLKFVLPVPFAVGELVSPQHFLFRTLPVVAVEEIPAPAVWRHQHIVGTLTVCITVKPCGLD